MRSMIRYSLCVAVGALALISGAAAQRMTFEEYLREKTRWSQEEIDRALRERVVQRGFDSRSSAPRTALASAGDGDLVVSADADVESEVHAAINPTDSNNIIVSPIQQGTVDNGLICPIYYTKDFGSTWRKSEFQNIPNIGGQIFTLGGGDPIVAFDNNGTAYLFWLLVYIRDFNPNTIYSALYWAHSNDGGVTWTQPENNTVALSGVNQSAGTGFFYDKEWVAVDRGNSIYSNTIYMSFVEFTASNQGYIVVRRKLPDALEFQDVSVRVSDDSFEFAQFANIDVDLDGNVHVTFLGKKNGGESYALWHAVSTDGGGSFSDPTMISNIRAQGEAFELIDSPITGILDKRLNPCPQFALDRSDGPTRGNLYITWTSTGITDNTGEGLDVYLARSTDGGKSWSAPIVVHDDPRKVSRHQFYSSISVNQNGVVAVTWYDRRSDSLHRSTDYYMAYSFDGGLTFNKNFPVSTRPTDFATVGGRNNGFGIGEYTQVVTSPGHAIAVWTDGRGNSGDLDIYAAVVPIQKSVSGVTHRTVISGKFRLLDPAGLHPDAVEFRLEEASHATLRVYDEAGKLAATLADGRFEPGSHRLPFDPSSLPAGRYFCTLETDFGSATRMMMIVR